MQQSKQKSVLTKSNKGSGVVRIIGGKMGGRKLRFNTIEGLRPTLDRIRETLFNWLASDIADSRCLDLFAGSGALGFEAASRGAQHVVLVEQSEKVCRDLKSNCKLIQADNIKVINLPSHKFINATEQKFDMVFLDPPFAKNLLKDTLDALPSCLNPGALVYIEQEQGKTAHLPDEQWLQLKFKQTSSFSYALYQLNPAYKSS